MKSSMVAGLALALVLALAGCGNIGASKEQYVQRGNELFEKGQFADATLDYRNALQKDPAYAEAYYRFGLLLSKEGNGTEALTMLEKAIELEPSHNAARLALAALYLQGLTYLSTPPQAFYDQLQRIAQSYLKADPKSFDGHRLLGHIAMLDSKPAEAAVHFRAALEAQPDSIEMGTFLTQSLLASGKLAEGEAFARNALAVKPTQGALYDILYFHYRNTKRPRDAEELLQRKIAANPKESLYVIQLAHHYQSLRQPKEVDKTLATLTNDGSSYPDGLLAGGDFVRNSGDAQRAIALYQRGIERDPSADTIYRKRLADTYIQTNQPREAAALLETLLRSDPSDKEIVAAAASLRAASGNPAEIESAIAEFTKLVAANPQTASYRYSLARALRMRGREDDARAQLLKAIESDPNHLPSLEELAGLSIQRANAKEAIIYAERAIAVNPNLPRTRLAYSAALALQGDMTEARREIYNLLREYPTLREVQLQLALLNIQENRFREAEDIYRHHYKPGQKDPRILRGLIELGFVSGKPESVLRTLQEEVKLQPTSSDVRMMLATTAARMNKPLIALEQFQWLKQNMPPSANIEMMVGLAHQQAGDWPAALAQFLAARKLSPKDPDVIAAIAYALQQSGRPGEAVPLYRESMQLKPNALAVKNNLAMALADSGGDLNEALQLSLAASGKDPSNALFSDALGLVYMQRKETAKAIEAFRVAVAKNPANVSYRIHLAKVLAESGNTVEANAELVAATAKNPSTEERKAIAELISAATVNRK